MDNMKIWDKVYKPPTDALKKITGGRLSGMTDISPQWRYQALTELFGPCGNGWRYETVERWKEDGPEGVVMVFVRVNFFYRKEVVFHEGERTEQLWSEPIEGVGGSTLIALEKSGLRGSDEAYKMATTDAISTAVKLLGVGGAIYAGKWDGAKYKEDDHPQESAVTKIQAKLDTFNNVDELNMWEEEARPHIDKLSKAEQAKSNKLIAQYAEILIAKEKKAAEDAIK